MIKIKVWCIFLKQIYSIRIKTARIESNVSAVKNNNNNSNSKVTIIIITIIILSRISSLHLISVPLLHMFWTIEHHCYEVFYIIYR